MAALALFLALLLAASAVHKLADRARAGEAAARMTGASAQLGIPLAMGAAAVEICAALALLIQPAQQMGAAIAASLWLGYGAALARLLGRTLDCGCDFTARAKPVDTFMIARPLLLAGLAGLVMMLSGMAITAIDPFAALGLLALWFAGGEIAAVRPVSKGARA